MTRGRFPPRPAHLSASSHPSRFRRFPPRHGVTVSRLGWPASHTGSHTVCLAAGLTDGPRAIPHAGRGIDSQQGTKDLTAWRDKRGAGRETRWSIFSHLVRLSERGEDSNPSRSESKRVEALAVIAAAAAGSRHSPLRAMRAAYRGCRAVKRGAVPRPDAAGPPLVTQIGGARR